MTGSKIRNFPVLATNKLNMKMIDEIKIKRFSKFGAVYENKSY